MSGRRLCLAAVVWGAGLAAPVAAHAADDGLIASSRELRSQWPHAWSPSWPELVVTILAVILYAMRASQLGARLPRWRALCFLAGILVLTVASSSPIDPVGEDGLFWVHMLQHVLIGDLAALLLVLGVTGPILQPFLKMRWVQTLHRLTHPVAAFVLWTVLLVGWHVPVAYEAALKHGWVHAIEHISFLTAGLVMWSPILESLPAPEWFGSGAKLLYLTGVRSIDAIVANAFWWAGTAFYPRYEVTAPIWGLNPLQDQGYAGTVMMMWTGTSTLVVSALLFFRMAREGELRQDLIERGLDPVAVKRAVRYGRAEALARRHGIDLSVPLGSAGPTRSVGG